MTTSSSKRNVKVLLLLAICAGADRPGSLSEGHHATLQAKEDSVHVHAGGHFSKGHHHHEVHHHKSEGNKHATSALEMKDNARPPLNVPEAPDAAKKANAAVLGEVNGVAGAMGAKANDDDYKSPGNATCDALKPGGFTCPKACPFSAEADKAHCQFKCVTGDKCGTEGTVPANSIADSSSKVSICRRCDVEGCLTCEVTPPGTDSPSKEKCTKCMPGYYKADLDGDGEANECKSWSIYVFGAIAVVAAVVVLGAIVWFVELSSRSVVNVEGLEYGLECRARSKVRQPANTLATETPEDGIGPRKPYPFDTNLCTTNVAGPGNMLFFRFQAAGLVWAITLTTVWVIMVFATDSNLFSLGLKSVPTPEQMCFFVTMGRKLQLKFIWVKVYWLVFAYVFSFLGAVYYAVNCLQLFQQLDNDHTTMADFVARCRSLPIMNGDLTVEDTIKEAVEKQTGEKVVGVSVCWNFHDKVLEVKEALEEDVGSLEHCGATNTSRAEPDPAAGAAEVGIEHAAGEEVGFLTGLMDKINNATLAKWHCHFHEHDHEGPAPKTTEQKAEETKEMLKGLSNTEIAFVVFETEDSRDKALKVAGDAPIPLADQGFFLEYEDHEPESCCWEDFQVEESEIAQRLSKGVMWMTMSLIGWTGLLYMPYAHYMGSFSYANGDEPGQMSEGIFVCLVVGAQIGLFVVASIASHHAGFCFEDDKQRTYIVLYNSALIVNLILDMSLTAFLAYHQMVGRGVRAADGRLLGDLPTLQEIIESYPMQKAVGNNLFKYCWPATFFVPFFAEPFAAQIGPFSVGSMLVRSNPKMKGENAEKALELSEPEQGRYADVIFNAILVSAIPFLAPGYILITFAAMIFSHLYIYFYDHWRVLRCCTRFWFASDTVSKFAQKLFSIPCGILAAALVFKANQYAGAIQDATHCHGADMKVVALNADGLCPVLGSGPLNGWALGGAVFGAMFAHILIHVLVLDYVVPGMGLPDNVNATETYEDCAARTPCSWFSANPIHCLRSKYIFKHDPPQTLFVIGKEHLQQQNPKINAHFAVEADEIEDQKGL